MVSKIKTLGFVLGYTVIMNCVMANSSKSATLEEMILEAEKNIEQTEKNQARVEEYLNKIEKDYQSQLMEVRKENPKNKYDIKVQEAQEQKKANSKKTEQIEEKVVKKQTETKKENVKSAKPKKYVPKKKTNGRRPFRKSSDLGKNIGLEKDIYVATLRGKEILSFAEEATNEETSDSPKVYSGTTEENVFVFSDKLANYCQIDTKNLDKMADCIKRIIRESVQGNNAEQQKIRMLYQESLLDITANSVAEAAKSKNDSAGFEKNVLIPLQEKSSKSTDERGDIEVLTFSQMEEIKIINKLIQIYANMLSREAFKDIGSNELRNASITSIDEEYEQQNNRGNNE